MFYLSHYTMNYLLLVLEYCNIENVDQRAL